MSRRERVLASINFQPVDRLPRDLGAMRSTGISAFAYPRLVAALGLPPRLPRIHDSAQMLALPDLDVLDALDCDVVAIDADVTNAFPEPEKWFPYDFNGRLPALVRNPADFRTEPDGTIVQWGKCRMPATSHVFNDDHAGQPVMDFDKPLPLMDLKEHRRRLDSNTISESQANTIAEVERETREVTHCLARDSGYVFCNIHNILAEIQPEKVIAMCKTAGS